MADSRIEEQITAIINEEPYTEELYSRVEAILQSMIDNTPYDLPTYSRLEDLLLEWKEASGGGDISVEGLSVNENGTYTAPSGTAYSPVTVNVDPTPRPPAGYTEIDYVECPSSGQAGFVVSSYSLGAYDIHECKTMPYGVEDEGAFAGVYTSSAIEFYYADGYANVYASQSATIINTMGKQAAETGSIYYHRAMKDRRASGDFTIGYYRYNYYPFHGRIYYYKIYKTTNNSEGIELIYNFIPCVRDADGKVGMYDIINDAFYSSTTGTEFVAPSE